MMKKKSKLFQFAHDSFFIIILGLVLLVVLESSIRALIPQDIRMQLENGLTIGKRDSVLGHINQPLARVSVKEPEYTVEYACNAEGFRDETAHPVPKPPNIFRILLLGDSFTWGSGVNYTEIWPVIFEQNYGNHRPNIDIVKAGVSGYDTRQEVLYLQRLLPLFEPDVVAIAFLPNDLVTNMPIIENDSLSRLEIIRQDSLVAWSQKDKRSELQAVTLFKRLLMSNDFMYTRLYLSTERATYFTMPLPEKLKQQIATTETLLTTAATFCRERKVQFMVVSIPQLFQVIVKARDQHPANIDVDLVDREFLRFAKSQGFPWIETLPVLTDYYRKNKEDIYFRLDGHLNKTGHRLVGDYLSRRFTEIVTPAIH